MIVLLKFHVDLIDLVKEISGHYIASKILITKDSHKTSFKTINIFNRTEAVIELREKENKIHLVKHLTNSISLHFQYRLIFFKMRYIAY